MKVWTNSKILNSIYFSKGEQKYLLEGKHKKDFLFLFRWVAIAKVLVYSISWDKISM